MLGVPSLFFSRVYCFLKIIWYDEAGKLVVFDEKRRNVPRKAVNWNC